MSVVLGLVGQVCAGKSLVAAAFRRRGAWVWEADAFVHRLYEEPEVRAEVRRLFGEEVFSPAGEVNRGALGRLVFNDPAKLRRLTTEIVFPRTGAELRRVVGNFRKAAEAHAAPSALALDAPTLFEAGRETLCDRLVFVAAPRRRRECWARENRGWSEEEPARREKFLAAEKEKRRRADVVLENDGTPKDLDAAVGRLWAEWGLEKEREQA